MELKEQFKIRTKGKSTKVANNKKTIKQIPPVKIVIKVLAVLMFIFGFTLTYNMPEKIYGVSWWELGAMSEGYPIEDTEAMLEYLEINSMEMLDNNAISSMKTQAYDSLEVSLLWSCVYWFVCSALIFIHIPNKIIVVKE